MTITNTPKPKAIRPNAGSGASSAHHTKKEQLIRLLSTRAGRDIPTISRAFGWQAHSTRAALSGLRKAGYELAMEKAAKGKPARYRITAAPPEAGPTVPEVLADAG